MVPDGTYEVLLAHPVRIQVGEQIQLHESQHIL